MSTSEGIPGGIREGCRHRCGNVTLLDGASEETKESLGQYGKLKKKLDELGSQALPGSWMMSRMRRSFP